MTHNQVIDTKVLVDQCFLTIFQKKNLVKGFLLRFFWLCYQCLSNDTIFTFFCFGLLYKVPLFILKDLLFESFYFVFKFCSDLAAFLYRIAGEIGIVRKALVTKPKTPEKKPFDRIFFFEKLSRNIDLPKLSY